jgi:MFS family permease
MTAIADAKAAGATWSDLLREGRAPVLALILLGDWLIAADALVTATIMPAVGASLDAFAWFGWAAAAFLTALVVAAASAGWLGERLGLRTAMIFAGLVLAIGCMMSAAAPGIAFFLLGRALQGCAGGWLIGLIYVALAMLFPTRHLPRVFALATSVWGVATLAGPLIGGIFADAGIWRGVFWFFAAQALLFTAAAAFLIPQRPARGGAPDLAVGPLLLLAVGIGALASAGIVAAGWLAFVLASGGAAALALAFIADRKSANGVVPTRAADPRFPLGAAYLTYFATTAGGVAFALYGPAIVQFTAGLGALEAGYLVALEALAWTAASLTVAGAPEAWRVRLIGIGAAAILLGVTSLTLVIGSGELIAIGLAGALLGAGYGLSYAFISQQVIGAFGEAERARGSSAIGAVRNAGGAVGASLAALAANAGGFGAGLSEANIGDVAAGAFGIGIPFGLLGLAAALVLARSRSVRPAQAAVGLGISESA